MAAKNASKVAEANGFITEAEKHVKTSFLKWKPDYDSAAASYTKAAVALKNADDLQRSLAAYVKAAECQMATKALFHAAKSLEQAAFIAKDLKDLEEAAKLIERASNLYLENGTPDTAAIALSRAAKMVETSNPERAVHLYLRAADVAENEGRPKQAADSIRQASRLLIRSKRHAEAVAVLQREIAFYNESDGSESSQVAGKSILGLVLLHLYMGDYVAARKAFNAGAMQCSGFAEGEDGAAALQLLDALCSGDTDVAGSTLLLPVFKYLDNDFAKLARDMRAPKASTAPAVGVAQLPAQLQTPTRQPAAGQPVSASEFVGARSELAGDEAQAEHTSAKIEAEQMEAAEDENAFDGALC